MTLIYTDGYCSEADPDDLPLRVPGNVDSPPDFSCQEEAPAPVSLCESFLEGHGGEVLLCEAKFEPQIIARSLLTAEALQDLVQRVPILLCVSDDVQVVEHGREGSFKAQRRCRLAGCHQGRQILFWGLL